MNKTMIKKIISSLLIVVFISTIAFPAVALAQNNTQRALKRIADGNETASSDMNGNAIQLDNSGSSQGADASVSGIMTGDAGGDIDFLAKDSQSSANIVAPIEKKNLIKTVIGNILPKDGLTIKERASNMAGRIREGKNAIQETNVKNKIDFDNLTSRQATVASGKIAFKNAFSPVNIGFSAATTVGFKIFEQVKNGEKVDIIKAASELTKGKYIGSFIGSGLGSVAGNMVGTAISTAVPGVGPIIGAFMPALFSMAGGALGGQFGDDISKGYVPSFQKAWASIDKVDLAGRVVGTTVGAAIGSLLLPGVGTAIGSIVGGIIGSKVAGFVKGLFNKDKEETPVTNKVDNIRYGVDPQGVILNILPQNTSDEGKVKISDKYVELKQKMINAYNKYKQYLTEGKLDDPECKKAFEDFKESASEIEKINAQNKASK